MKQQKIFLGKVMNSGAKPNLKSDVAPTVVSSGDFSTFKNSVKEWSESSPVAGKSMSKGKFFVDYRNFIDDLLNFYLHPGDKNQRYAEEGFVQDSFAIKGDFVKAMEKLNATIEKPKEKK